MGGLAAPPHLSLKSLHYCNIIFISELLLCREEIASRLKMQLDAVTDPWGISVERVTMKGFKFSTFIKKCTSVS